MTACLGQRYCIKFCQKLGDTRAETKEWFNRVKDGCMSADSDQHSGRPSTSWNADVIDSADIDHGGPSFDRPGNCWWGWDRLWSLVTSQILRCSRHNGSETRMRRTRVTPLHYLAATDASGGVARQQKNHTCAWKSLLPVRSVSSPFCQYLLRENIMADTFLTGFSVSPRE
jgi:hypothetical protein